MRGLLGLLLLFGAVIVGGCDYSTATPSSGIIGTVVAGPACPGPVRVGSPCPDRPAAVQLTFQKDGAPVASVTSSADGRFKVDLTPGRYVILGAAGRLPSVRQLAVDVPAGAYVEVAVSADTGIR
jgi:hypothetical protein